jgi:hypothetical protein
MSSRRRGGHLDQARAICRCTLSRAARHSSRPPTLNPPGLAPGCAQSAPLRGLGTPPPARHRPTFLYGARAGGGVSATSLYQPRWCNELVYCPGIPVFMRVWRECLILVPVLRDSWGRAGAIQTGTANRQLAQCRCAVSLPYQGAERIDGRLRRTSNGLGPRCLRGLLLWLRLVNIRPYLCVLAPFPAWSSNQQECLGRNVGPDRA